MGAMRALQLPIVNATSVPLLAEETLDWGERPGCSLLDDSQILYLVGVTLLTQKQRLSLAASSTSARRPENPGFRTKDPTLPIAAPSTSHLVRTYETMSVNHQIEQGFMSS